MTEHQTTAAPDPARIVDPLSSIDLREKTEVVIRIDKEGFHYRGQFIADAGEAHRLMVDFLRRAREAQP
jgi:hypothetical protein